MVIWQAATQGRVQVDDTILLTRTRLQKDHGIRLIAQRHDKTLLLTLNLLCLGTPVPAACTVKNCLLHICETRSSVLKHTRQAIVVAGHLRKHVTESMLAKTLLHVQLGTSRAQKLSSFFFWCSHLKVTRQLSMHNLHIAHVICLNVTIWPRRTLYWIIISQTHTTVNNLLIKFVTTRMLCPIDDWASCTYSLAV